MAILVATAGVRITACFHKAQLSWFNAYCCKQLFKAQ